MNRFFKKLDSKIKAIDEGFLYQVDLNLSKNGVSRFSFVIDDTNVHVEQGARRDTPVFKICVPTKFTGLSYVDFHCPFSDCAETFEVSRKCKEDPKIKSGLIKIGKDITYKTKNHLVK